MKKWIVLLFTISMVLCLTACGCKHEWQDATCTSPQRCKLCNKTEGKTIPHTWIDATCTAPKTCSVCQETEGEPVDHVWKDATCNDPRTCEKCGITEGEKSAHTPGEWTLQEPNYVDAEQMEVKACTVCGEIVKQKYHELDKLHDGIYVIPSPIEFTTRIKKLLNSYTGTDVTVQQDSTSGNYSILVFGNDGTGAFMLTDAQGEMISDNRGEERKCFSKVIGLIEGGDAVGALAVAFLDSMLPSLSFDEVKEAAADLIVAGELSLDGIKFLCSNVGGSNYLVGFVID